MTSARLKSGLRRAAFVVITLVVGCGGRVILDGREEGGGGGETGGAAEDGGAGDGGAPVDAGTQCRCKGQPDYAPCVLPLMCCPCADHCQDPATFNCTCPTIPTCP